MKCFIRKEGEALGLEVMDSRFQYLGQGKFKLKQADQHQTRTIERIGMICKDTGITPFF